MNLDVWRYTTSGGRELNEDSSVWEKKGDNACFILGDGLGGHRGGKLASDFVTASMLSAWRSQPTPPNDRAIWLEEKAKAVNAGLLERQKAEHNQMKSTLVCLTLDSGKATWVHAGDSRLYYLHNGELQRLTADHSVTYRKYLSGEITLDAINFDEDRSALLNMMGTIERCHPESGMLEEMLVPGDGFLLCSDGFWEYLYDTEILVDWLKAENAQEWGHLLLLRVMDRLRPGSDNLILMTVLVE